MFRETLQSWLAESGLARRAAEGILRRHARRLLLQFDHQDDVRAQEQILRGLVHEARATPFGRVHDFQRIQTPADFRRLMPLTETTVFPAGRHCHRRAALTALGFAASARPQGKAHSARVVVQVAEAALVPLLDSSLPHYLRPFVRFAAGQGTIAQSGTSPSPEIPLRAVWRAQAPIALQDPRHGHLRLLADHGVFFEFVPAEEVGKERPARLALAEIELGAAYAVALTTGAGAWACLTDITIAFEQRDPPLLTALPPSRRPVTIRPPHRQIAGTPAVRPEMIVHSSWSVPADRG